MPTSRPAWTRYTVATGIVALAWGLREVLTPALGPTHLPFITFLPAVTWAAWYGGLGPGVLSVVLSSLAANWFFFTPVGSFSLAEPIALLSFPVSSALILAPIEMLHRVRRQLGYAHRTLSTTLRSIGD